MCLGNKYLLPAMDEHDFSLPVSPAFVYFRFNWKVQLWGLLVIDTNVALSSLEIILSWPGSLLPG